jgi:hypothetical protein
MEKKCNKCNIEKDIEEFSKNKNSKNGYRNECKNCMNIYRSTKFADRNEYAKKYRFENRDKINKKRKEKYNNDNLFRISLSIRKLVGKSFKTNGVKKNSKTRNILGCSFEEFKIHLESKFEPWMSWDNYGNPKDNKYELNKTWDIDHIIPISSASTQEEIIKLNHYTNLQPLCSYTNRFLKRDNF